MSIRFRNTTEPSEDQADKLKKLRFKVQELEARIRVCLTYGLDAYAVRDRYKRGALMVVNETIGEFNDMVEELLNEGFLSHREMEERYPE